MRTRSTLSTRLRAALPCLAALLVTGCAPLVVGAGVGAGYIVSQQVLPGNVHVTQVSVDVEKVWPSVKETMTFYQDPGTELTIQENPRSISAKVDGAKTTVEVEAYDVDATTIRVQAEKYLSKDNATAGEVMQAILDRIEKL
jgi:hypothetical protein